jgi:sugar phosphate isomerase/epimerase
MNLSYHMHPHDFEPVEGVTPFEVMIANTEASMRFQLDVCWAAAAGIDPAELINTHHARIVSLHLKDLAANRTESATAGQGVLDFDAIHKAAARIKSPLFYVERDGGAGIDTMAEARKAYEFLTSHGW